MGPNQTMLDILFIYSLFDDIFYLKYRNFN